MRRGLTLFLLVASVLALPARAADWPHLRGPHLDGRLTNVPWLARDGLQLEPVWNMPLGSGYSGIALSAGQAVTMFSDGESDYVMALDASTGVELWRYTIGKTYKGHDGSHDGPLSTPVIDEGAVYVLGPFGKLFALKLQDGSKIWSMSLAKTWNAPEPDYGFATTPLVEGSVLVVQVGATDGGSLAGLEKSTGRKLWSVGDGKVEYQSPVGMTLAGRRQVVAVMGKSVLGIDPSGGEALWQQDLGEKASTYSAHVIPVDGDRFLVRVGAESMMFQVVHRDGKLVVEERFRTREFGGSYFAPVFREGYLYGFKGQFLTCVDAASGERVWKSRPPGGNGLIVLDDRLVIFGADGNLVLAEASPEGYREISRRKILERSGYTWPSFADGKVFLRNLDAIASVAIVKASKIATAEVPVHESQPRTAFERWVRGVQASPDREARVQQFLQEHSRFPLMEEGFVHFIYVGEVEDVALQATMMPSGRAESLHRIEGTNFHFRTYELGKKGRIDYRFQIDFEDWVTDPGNPRKVPAPWDDTGFSELSLSGDPAPAFLADPSGARGRLKTLPFASKILENERELSIYLPADYDDGDARYPLLLIAEGDQWMEKGLLVNALDNLLAGGATPLIAVFIPRSGTWWREGGGSSSLAFARMLAEELVPAVERQVRSLGTAEGRAVMGMGGHAASVAYAVLRYGDVFGKAALQSVILGDPTSGPILEAIRAHRSNPTLYLSWNRFEDIDAEQGWDSRRDSRMLAEALVKGGYRFDGGELADSYGWGGWRSHTDEILSSLFPVK